jgi:hypothetical protein
MIRTVCGWAAAGSRIVLGVTLLGHENLQIGYKPNEHASAWFLTKGRVTPDLREPGRCRLERSGKPH